MKITEMIPKNMPQWAKDAMDAGQLFNVTFDKIKLLEEQLAESKPLDTQLKDYVLVPINKIHSIHSRNLEDTITRLELKNELEEMMGFES